MAFLRMQRRLAAEAVAKVRTYKCKKPGMEHVRGVKWGDWYVGSVHPVAEGFTASTPDGESLVEEGSALVFTAYRKAAEALAEWRREHPAHGT